MMVALIIVGCDEEDVTAEITEEISSHLVFG
jgi:hypothetical protein